MLASQAVVREALVRVVRDPSRWPAPSPMVLRNQLLDEAGSDARPLVTLLVRAAELDVPARVRAGTNTGRSWEVVQAPMVMTLVRDAFVQQDMARWAVDSWGIALGVPVTPLSKAPNVVAAAPVRVRGARAPVVSRTRRPAPPRPAPVRTAARPTTAVPRPRRAPWTDPAVLGVGGILLVVIVGAMVAAITRGPRSSQPVTNAVTPPASARVTTRASVGIPGVTQRALPNGSADSARLMSVRPASRAAGAPGPAANQLVRQNASVLMGTTASDSRTTNPDRAELVNGRVLLGRVEIVRAGTVVFRDAESGIRYEFTKAEVKEIVTEYGTRVRFGRDGSPENHRLSDEFTRGVSGTYAVRYRVVGTRGNADCASLWSSPPADDRAVVVHPPGSDTLTLSFVDGATFPGVIDGQGLFATSFAVAADQARNATALTTRVNGRFTLTGFDAQVNVIAYRRVRTGRDIVCQSTLGATGTKLVPAAASARR